MIEIRRENAEDVASIDAVNQEAFGSPGEGTLIRALRDAEALTLSLVAIEDDEVVGHVSFSPATIETPHDVAGAIGLAPMSVLKKLQRCGIGSSLVSAGLKELAAAGHKIVIVLGHPTYYPRFGFEPAVQHGIRSQYEGTEEAFMVLELHEGALSDVQGLAKYRREFGDLD